MIDSGDRVLVRGRNSARSLRGEMAISVELGGRHPSEVVQLLEPHAPTVRYRAHNSGGQAAAPPPAVPMAPPGLFERLESFERVLRDLRKLHMRVLRD